VKGAGRELDDGAAAAYNDYDDNENNYVITANNLKAFQFHYKA
jgi:hypothetical protein